MSTHNICFRGEIRKILLGYPLLFGYMSKALGHKMDKWVLDVYETMKVKVSQCISNL